MKLGVAGMTRREFVVGSGAAALAAGGLGRAEGQTAGETAQGGAGSTAGALTAAMVIARIKEHVGVPWREKTVDRVVAGDAATPVKGIATAMMGTYEVLERAVAAGCNLVITHEPTFYLHQDETEDLVGDPVLAKKRAYLQEHGLVVFHFHDHWHAHQPDGIAEGMMRELGWEKNVDPKDPKRFTFAGETLLSLAREMEQKTGARTMRVIGDPEMPVRRVLASWGYASRMPGIAQFRDPAVDVYVAGETREWELVEYVQDSVAEGNRKGLILLGHVASEEAGMRWCAEWMRGFVTEVPVTFVKTPEPFWSPERPPARGAERGYSGALGEEPDVWAKEGSIAGLLEPVEGGAVGSAVAEVG